MHLHLIRSPSFDLCLLCITSNPTTSGVSAGPHAAGLHPAPRDGRPRRLQEELRPLRPRPRPRRHVTASWACPASTCDENEEVTPPPPPSPPPSPPPPQQQQQHSHHFNDICRHMSEEAVAPIPPGHTQQSRLMAAAEPRPTPSQQL